MVLWAFVMYMGEEIEKNGWKTRMLLQVHDELIFEVPEDEVETFKEVISKVMENAIQLNVPLKVDAEVGDSWYDAK